MRIVPSASVKVTIALLKPRLFGAITRPLTETEAAVVTQQRVGLGVEAKVPVPAAEKLARKPPAPIATGGVTEEKLSAKFRSVVPAKVRKSEVKVTFSLGVEATKANDCAPRFPVNAGKPVVTVTVNKFLRVFAPTGAGAQRKIWIITVWKFCLIPLGGAPGKAGVVVFESTTIVAH